MGIEQEIAENENEEVAFYVYEDPDDDGNIDYAAGPFGSIGEAREYIASYEWDGDVWVEDANGNCFSATGGQL